MRRHLLASLLVLAAAAPAPDDARLAEARVQAATRLRAIESELSDRAAQVSALAEQRADAGRRLQASREALAPMLPLMQRLALYPAETLLAVPAPPGQALRGVGILHGLARTLESDAAAVRRDQAALDDRSRALQAAVPGLQSAQARQAEEARTLDAEIAAAQARRRDDADAEAQRRAAAEAARAETLRAAVTQLNAARPRPPAPSAGPDRAVVPVAGAIVRRWGDASDAGPAAGLSFRPPPSARVVAPCGGRVRFAGPFRSYGALVILDCGGGYAFVLAGLDRLDAAVGATLLPGEPLGIMPAYDAASPGTRPALYVELRKDGNPINPAPFLAAAAHPPSHPPG